MKPVAYLERDYEVYFNGATPYVPISIEVSLVNLGWKDQIELYTSEQLHAAIDDERQNPWKGAIMHAAITHWSYRIEHENDPRKALDDLLSASNQMALDPKISSDAAKLVQEAHSIVSEKDSEIDSLREQVAALTNERNNYYQTYSINCDIETKDLQNQLNASVEKAFAEGYAAAVKGGAPGNTTVRSNP